MQARLGTRIALIALASLAYVVGTHWLMTRAHESPWNVVGVLTPMLAAIAISAWRAGQRLLGAGCALLIAWLCTQASMGVQVSAQALYVAQHAGMHLFLAAVFGATLRAGHTPLITTFARRIHREFGPAKVIYTRKVTIAWTLYFIGMALVSVVLYAFASFEVWATFANLFSPIAVALMFGAEYFLRYRLHPEFERTTIADAIRSYMHGVEPADPVAATPPASAGTHVTAAQRDPVV
jgi:uncharacterized membrane protein